MRGQQWHYPLPWGFVELSVMTEVVKVFPSVVPLPCLLHVAVCTQPNRLSDLSYSAILYAAVQLKGNTALMKWE